MSYSPLLAAVTGFFEHAAAGLAYTEDLVLRKHLANLQTGVLGFLLPSLAIRILLPDNPGKAALGHVSFRLNPGRFAEFPDIQGAACRFYFFQKDGANRISTV